MVQLLKTYKDIDLDFTPHPITKDLAKKIGFDAVSRSIRNLIFTNFYDKPFNPSVGSGARKLLFENATALTANFLRDQIINVIQNFEPRAKLRDVIITTSEDGHSFNTQIQYSMVNQPGVATINILLEKIR